MSIRFEAVQVRLGDHQVFHRPLMADLDDGAMVAVVGGSGSGKSTLLKLLAGELTPSEGSVMHELSQIRWIPQSNDLAFNLTALENVALPLITHGMTGEEAEQQARAALDAVGLAESTGHLVEELSGGQQQRVAVARALAAPAQLVLADEPTSALDAMNRERVLRLLRDQVDGGSTVVITTNDPATAEACDRVIVLDPEEEAHQT